MKATIFLIALAVAGFLEREGYRSFAVAIILVAFWEALGQGWWIDLNRWWDRVWLEGARTVSGDDSAGLSTRTAAVKQLSGYLTLGLAVALVVGAAWLIAGTSAMIGLLAGVVAWLATQSAEVAELVSFEPLADFAEFLDRLSLTLGR